VGWIPTLYVAEGLPYALGHVGVGRALQKPRRVEHGHRVLHELALSAVGHQAAVEPVVDILKTRRQWIWATQLFIGAMLAGVALTIPAPHFFQLTLAFFWLLAFSSATHDIAADGFYMLATTEREQSFFVGFRSVFFNVGKISRRAVS
jgi:MFS transporter, PAT family, beta-lactamase induction signal transducer AmpG